MNTAQDTAEVFDPGTNQWSPLPNMAARRFGLSQTKLPDGRVLLVCGIRGGSTGTNPLGGSGQVPVYTDTCEVFDPATDTFTPTAPLNLPIVFPNLGAPPRAFHGASVLPNGNVFVTGGFVANDGINANGEAISTSSCAVWDGSTWTVAPFLPSAVSFHVQVPFGGGALLSGGFTTDLSQLATTAQVVLHTGAAVTPLAAIGTDGGAGGAETRAVHTMTALHDGTFLVYGGGLWPATRGDGWIYTP